MKQQKHKEFDQPFKKINFWKKIFTYLRKHLDLLHNLTEVSTLLLELIPLGNSNTKLLTIGAKKKKKVDLRTN